MARRSAFVFPLVAMALVACHDGGANGDGAAPNVSLAHVTFSAAPNTSLSVTPPHHAPVVCRAIGASGPLHRDADGGALLPGDVIGDDFTLLGAGGKLSVKNGVTTRETIFEGPGDVRVCVNGDEEMWMTSGVFTSVIGAGETPGAEVWIVTPHVIVRYGSGTHVKVSASTTKADVDLKAGEAWAYPLGAFTVADAGPPKESEGWVDIPGNGVVTFKSSRAPSQVVGDCEQAAKAAHDLAVQIDTHDASLADAAPKHVVLRRKAHALCAAAELVSARSMDLVERARLLPRARAGSAKWRDASANP